MDVTGGGCGEEDVREVNILCITERCCCSCLHVLSIGYTLR